MSVKDSACKEFFRDSERFADVCNGILFAGNSEISPMDLVPADIEYAHIGKKKDTKVIADLAKYWKKNDVTISLMILENQTNVDYTMVVRNMLTESLAYKRQIKDKIREHKAKQDLLPGAEYTCGIKREDRLTPVITIVIYLGKDAWDGAKKLHDFLKIDDKLKDYVTNHRINLYDYHDYDSYDEFSTDVGLAFKAMASRSDKNKLRQVFDDNSAELDGDATRFFGAILEIKDIDKYIKKDEDGKEIGEVCKAIDDIRLEGYEEGCDVGRAEGLEVGASTKMIGIIIKKVEKKKNLDVIADEVEEEIEIIRPMYDAVVSNPRMNAEEIYRIIFEKKN